MGRLAAALLVLAAPLAAAPPGTIRVAVEGPAAEVLALRAGVIRARAPVVEGVAELRGLPAGAYDLYAPGGELLRGVRTVHDGAPGTDARLRTRPVVPVGVKTLDGARVHTGGLAFPAEELALPAGLHGLRVEHPERVPSPLRLVRAGTEAALEVPLDAGLTILGAVRGPDGRPVAGAFVEVFADGRPTGRFTYAGPGGAFGLSGFRGDGISLRVRAPGRAEALVRVLFEPGAERARVRVRLEAGSAVRLAVRDPSGRPVPGAEAVLLPAWLEEALEEPRLSVNYAPPRRRVGVAVRFEGLRPGRRYRLLVSAPAYLPATTETFVAPAAGRTATLPAVTLQPGATLRGRVAGSGGVVVCEGSEGRRTCRTDRAGRFLFEGLDEGPHVLRLRDVDERGVEVRVEGDTQVELKPDPPGGTLEGFVSDHDGKPLAGVEVRAAGATARTDESGAFTLSGLPPGRAEFAVRFTPGPRSRAFADDPHLPRTERGVPGEPLRVRLDRAAALQLRLDARGQPLVRARILVEGASGLQRTWPLPRGARDAVIPDLAEGTYVVEVAAPGLLGTGGAVVRTGAPARVEVLHGRRVSGTLVLRRGTLPPGAAQAVEQDLPLARGWVRLLDWAPARRLAVVPVDEEGRFRLGGLPPGAVRLCYAAPGYPPAVRRVDLGAGDREDLVLALFDPVEAAVRVLAQDGRPLPEARVRVQTEGGVDIRDLAGFARFLGVVADDEDAPEIAPSFRLRRDPGGRVWASHVAPGSYLFFISAEGYRGTRFGVRARTAWGEARIRQLEGVPEDLAPPVRLAPAKD